MGWLAQATPCQAAVLRLKPAFTKASSEVLLTTVPNPLEQPQFSLPLASILSTSQTRLSLWLTVASTATSLQAHKACFPTAAVS